MLRRVAVATVLFVLFVTPALAEKRVALVIGNNAYAEVPVLRTAVNDAEAMGITLERLGFAVVRATNATRRQMNRQIQSFVNRIEPGDVALLFYAGHGVEVDGQNFLLPTDIPDAPQARKAS